MKAFGNVEQAEMLILEQILIQSCIFNLPQIFNTMALEYSQLNSVYKRHDASQNLHRIKRIKTEEKAQHKKENPDDLIALLMAATQNNLTKMHHGVGQNQSHNEIRNYHVEEKPMYRLVRAFQWGNEGEKSLMLANVNSMITNFPQSLKQIDVTNSMIQIIAELSKEDPKNLKYLEFFNKEPLKTTYHFNKLLVEHKIALDRYELNSCRTIEDKLLLYNDRNNSQLDYCQIWE